MGTAGGLNRENSPGFDRMSLVLREEFSRINAYATPRLAKAIDRAFTMLLPAIREALAPDVERADPDEEKRLRDLAVEVRRSVDLALAGEFDSASLDFRADTEWQLVSILKGSFAEGAEGAAIYAGQVLTDAGYETPLLTGLDFSLTHPGTLQQIELSGATMVRRVNDGTRYYLQQSILRGVNDGIASVEIADLIKDGAGLDEILGSSRFKYVKRYTQDQLAKMSIGRIDSIVNTEINRAETDGRLTQWAHMGLSRKRWVHTGEADQCHVCLGNEAKGLIDMDALFDSVWGPATIPGPPAHPRVCHCHIEFDEDELIDKAGQLNVPWDGGDSLAVSPADAGLTQEEPVAEVPDLQSLLRDAAKPDRTEITRTWLRENRQQHGPYLSGGMSKEQTGWKVRYKNIDWIWGKSKISEAAMVDSLEEVLGPPGHNEIEIPQQLWDATHAVVLTHQRNRDDAMWAEIFGEKGFLSGATGGNGTITVYNNQPMRRGTFVHESAHNLAKVKWGVSEPPEGSDYGTLRRNWELGEAVYKLNPNAPNPYEPPVRKYGHNNGAEDWATAVDRYVTAHRTMKGIRHERWTIIDRVFKDPDYGG